MGTWRTAFLCLLAVVPGLAAACGSSDQKVVRRAGGEAGEGSGGEGPSSGGSSAERGGEAAMAAGVPNRGGAPFAGAGEGGRAMGVDGGEPGAGGSDVGQGGGGLLVTSGDVVVNSGKISQLAMLGDLGSDGPRFVCDNPAMNRPEQHPGTCIVSECYNSGTPEDVAVGQVPARGAITLAGGPTELTVPPDAIGAVDLFVGGEAMTVSAPAGDLVPAFSFSFTAPALPVLSAPTWVAHPTKWTLATDQDITLSWSPAAAADLVMVTLSTSNPNGDDYRESISLECAFAMTAGTGAVPASLLQQLPTVITGTYSFSVHAVQFQSKVIDGFPLELRVRRELETAGGVYTTNGNVALSAN